MLEIGLTGGIGSGKSTVAQLLVDKGAHLVDADAIARELQQPGQPVFEAMVERWGDRVVADDGTLNRAAVAEIAFNDDEELKALNEMTHPAIGAEMMNRRNAHKDTDHTVILDIPLLVESGHEGMGGVIVVDTDPELAVERLIAFRGFSEEDARKRVMSQASRDDRLARADFVVENNADLDALAERVDECWAWIQTLPRPEIGTEAEYIMGRGEKSLREKAAE